MYELVDGDPGPLDVSVPAGTSLLLAGPAMTRKSQLALAVLATGYEAGAGVTAVSTEDDADTLEGSVADRVGTPDTDRFGVVDCTGRMTGEGLSGPGRVQHVPSPNDLTGIGIAVTRAMEAQVVRSGRYRLALDSLSTLLSYRDTKDVFKFCHVLVSRLGGLGCRSVFTLDTDAHDDQTVNMIARTFGAVDVRRAPSAADHDAAHEVRLRGLAHHESWMAADLP
jgi:KaiC/GvpD/RAD55 family RecA-like ATPase